MRHTLLLILLVLGLTLSGCSDDDSGGGPPPSTPTATPDLGSSEPPAFSWAYNDGSGEKSLSTLSVLLTGQTFSQYPTTPYLRLVADIATFCTEDSLRPGAIVDGLTNDQCPGTACNIGPFFPIADATHFDVAALPQVTQADTYAVKIHTFSPCKGSGSKSYSFNSAIRYLAPTPTLTPTIGPSATPTATPSDADSRAITMINNCDETVWAAAFTGATSGGWELSGTCAQDSDCGTPGATCNAAHHCQVTVRFMLDSSNLVSGRIWPRTGCTFNPDGTCPKFTDNVSHNCCATGGCTTDAKGVNFGLQCMQSGVAPTTVAEFTLQTGANNDYYDVSLISGFNVPVEMKPNQGSAACDKKKYGDCRYWCANPGGPSSDSGLSACPWDLGTGCSGQATFVAVAPTLVTQASDCKTSAQFLSGTPIGSVCTCNLDDAVCKSGETCGFPNNEIIGTRVCGTPVGCTTGNALCGIGAYFTGSGGAACTEDSQCASGDCKDNTCTPAAADFLSCGQLQSDSLACTQDDDCPALIGFPCTADTDCPYPTRCVSLGHSAPGKPDTMNCREPCDHSACSTDADCTSPSAPPCTAGKCAGSKVCVGSTCKSDQDCLFVDTNPPTCPTDGNCSPGWTCTSNHCEVAQQACTKDDDCTVVNMESVAGWTCNTSSKECQPPMVSAGTFMLCDTNKGQCVSTNASLLESSGVNGQSCYIPYYEQQVAPSTSCGGCPTDCQNPPCLPWPDPFTGDSCRNSNPAWVDYVLPQLGILKSACPTAYSFPFDDTTSTFQCRGDGSGNLGYTVTFCPAAGAPGTPTVTPEPLNTPTATPPGPANTPTDTPEAASTPTSTPPEPTSTPTVLGPATATPTDTPVGETPAPTVTPGAGMLTWTVSGGQPMTNLSVPLAGASYPSSSVTLRDSAMRFCTTAGKTPVLKVRFAAGNELVVGIYPVTSTADVVIANIPAASVADTYDLLIETFQDCGETSLKLTMTQAITYGENSATPTATAPEAEPTSTPTTDTPVVDADSR